MDGKRWITKNGHRILINNYISYHPMKATSITNDYMNKKIKKTYTNTNDYMNNKIRNKTSEINKMKTQKEKVKYINDTYKDKLRYPIQYFKVKKFWTGDKKTGKYDWQYNARTKSGQDIMTNSLEELDEKLKKEIYK